MSIKKFFINHGYALYLGAFASLSHLSFVQFLLMALPTILLVEVYNFHTVMDAINKFSLELDKQEESYE